MKLSESVAQQLSAGHWMVAPLVARRPDHLAWVRVFRRFSSMPTSPTEGKYIIRRAEMSKVMHDLYLGGNDISMDEESTEYEQRVADDLEALEQILAACGVDVSQLVKDTETEIPYPA